jgi:2-amino-4-hydroxy-6-hydroxymethyldihydropteridine diphosphokinase
VETFPPLKKGDYLICHSRAGGNLPGGREGIFRCAIINAVLPVNIYLGLGCNMGNREQNLKEALQALSSLTRLGECSSIYETDSIGDTTQPKYLNMACKAATRLSPFQLLTLLKSIEARFQRTGGSGLSRPIDLDILFYDKITLQTPRLTIPHPKMAQRAFVLVPLAEIAPDLMHPVSGLIVKEVLADVEGMEGVVKWS